MNIEDYLELVIKNDLTGARKSFKQEFLYYFGQYGFSPFLQACQLGYPEMVKFFLEKKVDIELASSNGWNGLHWAAGDGHNEVVEILLQNGANKESETKKNYRPLHCATVGDRDKTVRLLLAHDCDYTARNKDGQTSLEIAEEMGNKRSIYILKKWINYDKIFDMVRQKRFNDFKEAFLKERVAVKEKKSGKTIIDVAVESKSTDCLELIISEDIDEKVIVDSLKLTLTNLKVSLNHFKAQFRLYRSILSDVRERFQEFALVDVVNSPWVLTGESFLNICVKFNRKDMVIDTLLMLMDHKKGLKSALEIATAKNLVQIKDIITQRKDVLDASDRASYSRLHIAVQDNRVDVVRGILADNLVDGNVGHQIVGPPICFALLLRHGACVSALLEHGVSVNVTNKYRQTPLHIAVENGMISFCSVIIDRIKDINERDMLQLTSLHHAVINKDEGMCRLLLNRGADLWATLETLPAAINDSRLDNAFFPLSNEENPVTLCLKLHKYILPSLLEKLVGNNIKFVSEDGNTILHLSSKFLLAETCLHLIRQGSDVNGQNGDGNTPAHELFIKPYYEGCEHDGFLETLSVLVDSGANVNLINNAGISTFKCAFDSAKKEIVSTTLRHCDKVDCRVDDLFTAYDRNWPDVFQKIFSLQKHEFKVNFVIRSIEEDKNDVVDFILEHGPEELQEVIVEDSLYSCARKDNQEIFDKISEYKLKKVKYFPGGETLLTKLIKERNEKYCLQLAKSKCGEIFLDCPNQNKETPLYLAADMGCLKMCKHLVLEPQNNHYIDGNGETAMERLFKSSSDTESESVLRKIENIVKAMIRCDYDVNRVNKANQRAISFCKNNRLKTTLEAFQKKTDDKRPKRLPDNDEDKHICEICMDKRINCNLNCGHPFCFDCATQVIVCPKCRTKITERHRLFI